MPDDARLAEICVRLLGERHTAVLFRAGYLSQVTGVALPGGATAVIKIRPAAGLAAAVWPAGGQTNGAASHAATVRQSADFIARYQAAASPRWSERDIQNAWAAGLWVRLFNAKKDAAFGDFPSTTGWRGRLTNGCPSLPSKCLGHQSGATPAALSGLQPGGARRAGGGAGKHR